MELRLIGHNYKYAAEQMLLTLYPDERPVYARLLSAGRMCLGRPMPGSGSGWSSRR